jgi:peptide/nickel transport system substrate-binding protein
MHSLVALTLIGAFSAALTACSSHEAASHSPDTLIIRLITDPGSLDPQIGDNAATTMAALFTYDRVLANVDGQIRPQIAERWQVTPTSVQLWIRHDVTCSDGHPLTATDVARNFVRMVDPKVGAPNATGIFGSTRITVTANDSTGAVDLQLAVPNSDILYGLARVSVICPAGLADLDRVRTTPNGTGPFVLTAAIPGDRYVYRRRPDYHWGPRGLETFLPGAPDTVVLQVVENESTAANMLVAGELDIARINGPDRRRLQADVQFTRRTVTPSLFSLFFNQHPGRITQDVSVRRALVQAINRRDLARAAVGPDVLTAEAFQAPGAPCYDPTDSQAIPVFNPTQADRALTTAGFPRAAARLNDGTRVDRNGQPITIEVIVPNDFALAADVVVDAWSRLGLRVHVRSESEAQITQTTFAGGDWDIVLVNSDATTSGRNTTFFTGVAPPNGLNMTFAHDPTYDSLVAQARSTEMPQACQPWRAANQRLLRNAFLTPVFYGEFAWFGRKADFKPLFNDQSVVYPTSLRRLP